MTRRRNSFETDVTFLIDSQLKFHVTVNERRETTKCCLYLKFSLYATDDKNMRVERYAGLPT